MTVPLAVPTPGKSTTRFGKTTRYTVHVPNGFSSIKLQAVDAAGAHFGQPGYETDLLYLAGIVALVLGGPGPLRLRLPRRR